MGVLRDVGCPRAVVSYWMSTKDRCEKTQKILCICSAYRLCFQKNRCELICFLQNKIFKRFSSTRLRRMPQDVSSHFVVVVGYPTPSEGWGMAEDHGAPEAGQLPRVWTRGRRGTKLPKRMAQSP